MYTQTIGFSIVAYSSTVSEIGVSFSDFRSDVILAIFIVETNEITEMIVIAIRDGINHILIGKTPFFALSMYQHRSSLCNEFQQGKRSLNNIDCQDNAKKDTDLTTVLHLK